MCLKENTECKNVITQARKTPLLFKTSKSDKIANTAQNKRQSMYQCAGAVRKLIQLSSPELTSKSTVL